MVAPSFEEALWAFRRSLPKRARIYVAGCSGEPLAFAAFLRANPEWADGVTFVGIWIPGVNRTDWAGVHPGAKAETIFLAPEKMQSFADGRLLFRPLSYTQSVGWLTSTPLDGAIAVTSTPYADGHLSLGISADFTGCVLARSDVRAMALANRAMPRPADTVRVSQERFDDVIATDWPLVALPLTELPPEFSAIGENVANLICDGDTLQFGLGNVQQAVLSKLTEHRRLSIHSGMVSDPLVTLLDGGAIADEPGAVLTGVALGTERLYTRAEEDNRFSFRPVEHTHAITTLGAIEQFKAINSAIAVDLFGQVNAEFLGPRQVSGTGGLVDFMRGAAASKGGRSIIALASTAKGQTISRIVPRLDSGAVSVARQDIDTVVTEYGAASLRHQTIDARAESLISIAHPDHRDALAESWRAMRVSMA